MTLTKITADAVAPAFDCSAVLNSLPTSSPDTQVTADSASFQAHLNEDGSRYATYNFEVESTHTYIAGDIRVHNTSILDYLPEGATYLNHDFNNDAGKQELDYISADGGIVHLTGTGFDDASDTIREDKTVVYDDKGVKIHTYTTYDKETNEVKDVQLLEFEDRGVQYGSAVGVTLGSQFGALIAGDNAFAKIGYSTILGTIGQNFGQFIQSSIKYVVKDSTDTTIGVLEDILTDYTLDNFGQELVLNLEGQVTGYFSSLLMGELSEAIGLEGFAEGAFTTAGNTITQQLYENLSDIDVWAGGLEVDEIFAGFETVNFVKAAGSFIGNTLANEVVEIDSIGESVFASIGSAAATAWSTSTAVVSAVSSAVAGVATTAVSTFLTALILPGIGAFIGTVGGAVIFETVDRWFGGALSDQFDKWFGDHPAYYREQRFDDENNEITSQTGFNKDSNRDIESVVNGMEEAYKDTMHAVIEDIGGDADWATSWTYHTFGYHHSDNPEGWDDFKTELFRNTDGQRVLIHGKDTAGMVRAAIFQNLQNLEFKDGDLIKVAAHENWKDDVTQLGDGAGSRIIYTSVDPRTTEGVAEYMRQAQIANDYRKYLDNKDAIDALIANEPDSAFASGWVATLLAAAELGLGKSHNLTGTDKDNVFIAGENHDIIDGAGGNDRIEGYQGDDVLKGGSGDDTLIGGTGDDRLEGGADSDTYVFVGNFGKDVVIDSSGSLDTIRFEGTITLSDLKFVKDGADLLVYKLVSDNPETALDELSNVLRIKDWQSSIERFEFADGSIKGRLALLSEGNDTFTGISSDDLIMGLGGNDMLNAGSGNDTLVGGAGNDQLKGGSGNDTYVFSRGFGKDTLIETSGTDTLRFEDGITLADLKIVVDNDGLKFYLIDPSSSDQDLEDISDVLTVKNWSTDNTQIERFEFADGSALKKIEVRDDGRLKLYGAAGDAGVKITGSDNDDFLYGTTGADVLDPGKGAGDWQHLFGYNGNDTYLYGIGGGNALISSSEGENDGFDTVRFIDLNLSDFEIGTQQYSDSNGLVVKFQWSIDGQQGQLRVAQMGDYIERFEFADGTVITDLSLHSHERIGLTGTDGDDLIIGTNVSNIIDAGKGNDTLDAGGYHQSWQHLRGQEGDDTYLIGADDGEIWITQDGEWAGSGTDTVRFKDLNLSDFEVTTYDHASYGEALRLSWTKDGQSGTLYLSDLGKHIERFEFADGSEFGGIEFGTEGRLRLLALPGDEDTIIYGSNYDDFVFGAGGNDTLSAVQGAGNWQYLYGYGGDDTYIYGTGGGNTLIHGSEGANDGYDIIRFADLSLADFTIIDTQDYGNINGVTLNFRWNNEGEQGQLRVSNLGDHIERFEFADGAKFDGIKLLDDGKVMLLGTENSSIMSGTSNSDVLIGGEGSDTFLFTNPTFGHDQIMDFEIGASSDDIIRFDGDVFSDYDDILAATSDDGTDTIIALDDDNSVTLKGVLKSDLHQDDFQLV
ncbi:Poly(beta-D-mannuronate) C5 epimerase 2 [Pseudovibrio sp. W64]|uniref:calcium-binding protein n=1 Tax=Pseudovibrio sp. W64 TaxID=1735583 RepID=UPI0007AEE458|nr:calcium-binding protein [Pseudovibrio sp. W64]KZK78470.1 Poly(beta-D-mannuronate) C5 epimerase 2 [Pseudovibrio sp. W64]